MLEAVVTHTGDSIQLTFLGVVPRAEEGEEVEVPEKDLNPIFPEVKELAWGFGSFVVFALLMRLVLFPRLKKGIDERYALIRSGHDTAERVRSEAEAEVSTYRAQVAELKAEAAQRVDAARATVETERQARIGQVNAAIAERKAAAASVAATEREAASADVESAVAAVAGRATQLAIGKAPSADVVADVVRSTLSAGVSR